MDRSIDDDSVTQQSTAFIEIPIAERRLSLSPRVGEPEYVLYPADLEDALDLCFEKSGARVVLIERDTVVKFCRTVRLAEAEAMHLISERTTIKSPRLKSAYILDDIGYIIMSFEAGRMLSDYGNDASEIQRCHVVEQMKDYVSQMRGIPGDFIGGVDYSPCIEEFLRGTIPGPDANTDPLKMKMLSMRVSSRHCTAQTAREIAQKPGIKRLHCRMDVSSTREVISKPRNRLHACGSLPR